MAESCQNNAGENMLSSTPGDSQSLDKRVAAGQLIKRYYFQLTEGCGDPNCNNENCASSKKIQALSPNQAAAQALDLFARKGRLCVGTNKNELPNTLFPEITSASSSALTDQQLLKGLWVPPTSNVPSHSTGDKSVISKITKLTETSFKKIIDNCKEYGIYSKLVHTLGHIFANPELLGQSFIGPMSDQCTSTAAHGQLSKEQLRSMEVDLDKDSDSQEAVAEARLQEMGQEVTVDVCSIRRSFEALSSIESQNYESALVHALILLCETIELDMKYGRQKAEVNLLNVFVVVFELPWLGSGDYFESVLPSLCRACAFLSLSQQATLVRFWAAHSVPNLRNLVQTLQQLISFRVLSGDFGRDYAVNDDSTITACVKVMRMLYCVNIFSCTAPCNNSNHASVDRMETDDSSKGALDVFSFGMDPPRLGAKQNKTRKNDPLMSELGVSILDCRKPPVAFADFYNEPLSDVVEMDRDFAYFAAASEAPPSASNVGLKISFMNFPFILTPAAKALGLYYDNRIRMYSERRQSIFNSVMNGQPSNPYLKLKIRRDHVIEDALIGLEMVAMENPSDLKKQLVVEFEGEQGIDEGGLSKEFFQLVIDQVFNPDYAMFAFNSDTRNFWFNPTSFESDAQFTLIGIILGLAIYNTIILDIHFPMVVYRKLLGRKGTFEDLQELDPTLWKGLTELLEYSDSDMEETLMQTFSISYKDVFGVVYNHDLKENGASCNVNLENRREFVELYADYLLNECIGRQFAAFHRGFAMVTDESPLNTLFRPEEVEQLVCGSHIFDFEELQNATEYDGGFDNKSETIQHFWSVVHELSVEDKRRLLQFTTGSDRVPVGGLGRLKLIIARNGADSDRLPMAHTCYNVLLLPEYNNKEKLKERLMKAIDYSKGFEKVGEMCFRLHTARLTIESRTIKRNSSNVKKSAMAGRLSQLVCQFEIGMRCSSTGCGRFSKRWN
ncbi:ubiquitin-protein ligase E3A isoform X2 [Daphnia magna]|uniref:ubiquitin-protein ligase E3A isoform X2 n=1 Tax=Daphnia magna TaxID=35525 RepID=UPI001E1BD51B|nr:ubiquitin-protein ligase E3A isoform X2 [Daphnia magna]